jgi:hypothetical protein
MNIRRQRRLLWLLSAAMLAALAGTVYALWAAPLAADGAAPLAGATGSPGRENLASHDSPAKPLSWYSVIHQRALRLPLYDPKPVVVAKVKPRPPTFAPVLTGTAIEPGFTYALFRRGTTDKLVRIGQTIENGTLTAVTANSATVKIGEHTLTLTVQKR